jgi:K+-sensing histidine kinase KdpD
MITNSHALKYMIQDLIQNILEKSEDLSTICDYISRSLCELLGVKLSLIVRCEHFSMNHKHELLSIFPHRYKNYLSIDEFDDVFPQIHQNEILTSKIDKTILENIEKTINVNNRELKLAFVIPLIIKSQIIGSILIFDTKAYKKRAILNDIFAVIAPLLSSIIKNSIQYSDNILKRVQVENEFFTLTKNAPIGIIKLDQNRDVESINSFIKRLCKELHIDFDFNDWTTIFNFNKRNEIKDFIYNINNFTSSITSKTVKNDNKVKWIKIKNTPLFSSKTNELKGYIIILIDITKDRKKSKKIKKALLKAKESDNLKTQFISNLSHEIRTPLNIIQGFSSMLMRKLDKNENNLKIEHTIKKNTSDLTKIIEDMLEMSILEKQDRVNSYEYISLNNFIKNMRIMCDIKIKNSNKDINLIINIDETDHSINSDRTKLLRIMTNLIDNAIKFTNKGTIEIGYKIKNNKVKIYVKDTGIGISKDHKKVIFNKFRQIEHSYSRSFGGLGIGLYISKQLAYKIHGKLKFKSTKDRGSYFYIKLPKELKFSNIQTT